MSPTGLHDGSHVRMFSTMGALGPMAATQAQATAIVGPVAIGWVVELFLFGIVLTTCSAYMYSPLYARDSRPVKLLLITVMALEGAQSGMNAWNLVHYATTQARDAGSLFYLTRLDCYGTLLLGIEGALVHTFLAARASTLFKSARLKVLYNLTIASLTVVSLVGACTYLAFSLELRAGKLHDVLPLNLAVGLWLWGTAAVTLTISAGLWHALSERAPGISPNDAGIPRLWRIATEIGAPATIAAVLGAVLSYALAPGSAEYSSSGAFFQPLCSFYALGLLSSLAHRKYALPAIVSVATLWDYNAEAAHPGDYNGGKGGGGAYTDFVNMKHPGMAMVQEDDQFASRRLRTEDKRKSMEILMSSGRLHDVYGTEKGEQLFVN